MSELRELKQLQDENRRLKQVVPDRTLDKTMLRETLGQNGEPKPATPDVGLGAGRL